MENLIEGIEDIGSERNKEQKIQFEQSAAPEQKQPQTKKSEKNSEKNNKKNIEKNRVKKVKHDKHVEKKVGDHTKKKESSDTISVSPLAVWQTISAVLLILLVLTIVLKPAFLFGSGMGGIGKEEARVKTLDFVNKNLLAGQGLQAKIDAVTEENGLYKMVVTVDGPQGGAITSYMSKDGKIFFPQGIEVVPANTNQGLGGGQQNLPDVPKTDKPKVELFVMSHCPYGTQIEKGILPVVELLGDKADIEVKFVNYAMHQKVELDEQMNQYCIMKEYPDEYFKYLQCFLTDANTERCLSEMKFDKTKLDACMKATDNEFGVTSGLEDKSSWLNGRYPKFLIHDEDNKKYGVGGSPTLVLNGVVVNSARDSNSLKNVICNSFTTAPEECGTELPKASPSPGFGYGTGGSDAAAANCGV